MITRSATQLLSARVHYCDGTVHGGLAGLTPLARYQRDLPRIRSLGAKAVQLDALFLRRIPRFARKDATVSYLNQRFEVPYELSGKTVRLVVDPHAGRVVGVEDAAGVSLGAATPLDMLANIHRTRRKPEPLSDDQSWFMIRCAVPLKK